MLAISPSSGEPITAIEEVEHLSACDILFNALAVNDEVERIIFCSNEVMKGQIESSSPQKQSLDDANVCVLQIEKREFGDVYVG